jgi:sirohydrochlorin ferrochelatase
MLSYHDHILGLILVDHGSTRPAANAMLVEVAALFKRVANARIVEPAHMELAEPTIAQAFDRCVEQGATLVIVHPYFLAPGKHSTTDIPRLTAAAAARHPQVLFHVTEPLGLDEKIAALIVQRVDACLANDLRCEFCRQTVCPRRAAALVAASGGDSAPDCAGR